MKIMTMMPCARISILLAMLVAVAAHAAPVNAAGDDLYARYFNTMAADNGFRAHATRWRRQLPAFDGSTDGCSGPARLTGHADHLDWPCVHHDFGYRNDRWGHRHDAPTRAFIDAELLAHTWQLCARYAVLARPGCYLARP